MNAYRPGRSFEPSSKEEPREKASESGALKLKDNPSMRLGRKIRVASWLISSYAPGLGSSERSKLRHQGLEEGVEVEFEVEVEGLTAERAAEKEEGDFE